jgi:hypothetical protein
VKDDFDADAVLKSICDLVKCQDLKIPRESIRNHSYNGVLSFGINLQGILSKRMVKQTLKN